MAKKNLAELLEQRKNDMDIKTEEESYEQTEMAGLPEPEATSAASAPTPAPASDGKRGRGRPRKADTALKTTYVRATITPEYKKKLRIVLAEQGKTEDAFVSELVMKAIDKAYAAIIGGN